MVDHDERERGPSPREAYRRRVANHGSEARRLARRGVHLSVARAAAVAATVVVAWWAVDRDAIADVWIALPAALFATLVAIHARTAAAQAHHERLRTLYERGLARLDGTWMGRGEDGRQLMPPDHLFAADLDLFGPGSLFELLCLARTRWGRATLAGWLLRAAPGATVVARQAAVTELADRDDLREELALVGGEVAADGRGGGLAAWARGEDRKIPAVASVVAAALPVVETVVILLWLVQGRGGGLLALLLVAHVVVTFRLRPMERRLLEGVARSAAELRLLSRLLAVAEGETFSSPELSRLGRAWADERPSTAIRALTRYVQLAESQRNMLFAPIAGFLFLGFHVAAACERWRRRHRESVPGWLEALGTLEALASLAWFAAEHPQDPFPELVEDGPLYEAEGLTHPLLGEDRAVRNDLRLDRDRRLLIVSGSNMSGKSTLLRSVGVNLVLAQAGAPVRARRLRLSPLALGASIATLDSLREGRSRFFTEITRLKHIVDLCAGPVPVLFLIDEVLHGTNSHERRIGAELILHGLLERGAVGLLTTHDLALADLSSLGPAVSNVHFQDEVVGEELRFDYRLRDGTVTRSNALALMRLVGLPVRRGD